MTKLALGTHPFLLGFDQLERLVERTAKTGNEGYPPYNIEQTSDHSYRITLAVAGVRSSSFDSGDHSPIAFRNMPFKTQRTKKLLTPNRQD